MVIEHAQLLPQVGEVAEPVGVTASIRTRNAARASQARASTVSRLAAIPTRLAEIEETITHEEAMAALRVRTAADLVLRRIATYLHGVELALRTTVQIDIAILADTLVNTCHADNLLGGF